MDEVRKLYNKIDSSILSRDQKSYFSDLYTVLSNSSKEPPLAIIATFQKAVADADRIQKRLEKCWEQCNALAVDSNDAKQRWFINSLESNLASAEDDFPEENCDDFEVGLKLYHEYMQSKERMFNLPSLPFSCSPTE